MKIIIRCQTIYNSHWESPKIFTVESEDMLGVRAIIGDILMPDVEWLTFICDAIPFCKGHDTYLIPPVKSKLMNSTYRGKIISVEKIAT